MKLSMETVRGATRLTFDSFNGIVNTVEGMHETIARRPIPLVSTPGQSSAAHGVIAASVYSAIRAASCVTREAVDWSLGSLAQDSNDMTPSHSEAVVAAALNGVCGDHLEATRNSLAIPMCFTTPQDVLECTTDRLQAAFPQASPHVVVLVHGLCLSEWSWSRGEDGDIGSRLRDEYGMTPLYLRYNSGRHISINGRELAEQLSQLREAWPVPIESLTLLGHSMGGLVIRSACWYGAAEQLPWLNALRRIVFMGTPHHGAPMEKAGHLFETTVGAIEYVEPLLLGRFRSAGIKDLRHGNLLDEDWQGVDPVDSSNDLRRIVPLLPGVDYYLVAATIGRHEYDLKGHILGDFLVRLGSATGAHPDELKRLSIQPGNCRIFHEANHFDLLSDERVHQQVVDWLTV